MAYVTTGEAAKLLGVGLNTVKRWIASGDLRGIRTPGGHWRIPEAALRSFMQARGMRIPMREDKAALRVLIVDDDQAACTMLAAILEQLDPAPEVKCVHDGYTGLIQIGSWRPDVLVLDILMPGINGLDVLHRLRSDRELLGDMAMVVVTSAFDQADLMRRVRQAAPDAILPKPVNAQRFLGVIEACLSRPEIKRGAWKG